MAAFLAWRSAYWGYQVKLVLHSVTKMLTPKPGFSHQQASHSHVLVQVLLVWTGHIKVLDLVPKNFPCWNVNLFNLPVYKIYLKQTLNTRDF